MVRGILTPSVRGTSGKPRMDVILVQDHWEDLGTGLKKRVLEDSIIREETGLKPGMEEIRTIMGEEGIKMVEDKTEMEVDNNEMVGATTEMEEFKTEMEGVKTEMEEAITETMGDKTEI